MSYSNGDHDHDHDRLVSKVVDSVFYNITDSIIDVHTAVKVLAITVTAEFGALAMLFVAKDKVLASIAESEDSLWIYAAILVYVIGFLTFFASYRLVANKWRHSYSSILIWPLSIIAGVANLFLFLALLTLERR
ncbi:MAG: hypothetical protein PSX80_09830 [bacterium]|nr:hypothetical protein [bacterium]